jgi:hypothetical protein
MIYVCSCTVLVAADIGCQQPLVGHANEMIYACSCPVATARDRTIWHSVWRILDGFWSEICKGRCSGSVPLKVVGNEFIVVTLHWRRKSSTYQAWKGLLLSSVWISLIVFATLTRLARLLDLIGGNRRRSFLRPQILQASLELLAYVKSVASLADWKRATDGDSVEQCGSEFASALLDRRSWSSPHLGLWSCCRHCWFRGW